MHFTPALEGPLGLSGPFFGALLVAFFETGSRTSRNLARIEDLATRYGASV